MKTIFKKSFEHDLKKLRKNHQLLKRIRNKIEEVEAIEDLSEISNLEKLSGGINYFRIRVGDYRMGIKFRSKTIEFIRCLHRREIYRYFP